MNKCITAIFAVAVSLFSVSCVSDKVAPAPATESVNEITVSFLMDVPYNTLTRSIGTVADNSIENLDILSFTVSGGAETFSYRPAVTDIADTDKNNIKMVTAKVQKGTDTQRFVLVANAADQIEALTSLTEGAAKEDVLAGLVFSRKGEWSDAEDKFTPIPMWGESDTYIINDNSGVTAKIKMLRMAAKIQAVIADDLVTPFSISEIHVYNAPTRGRVVPLSTNLTAGANGHKAVAATMPADDSSSDPLRHSDALRHVRTTEGMLPTVYVFESDAVQPTVPSDAMCIVVGAQYNGDTSPSYYRLDFVGRDDEGRVTGYLDVLRNHQYIFTVTSVGARGYSTAKEAFEARTSSLEADLYVWEQGDITEFVYNSQYMLGVSQKEMRLGRRAQEMTLLVTTDYEKSWKATTGEDWLDVTVDAGNYSDTKEPLTFTVEENKTGQERTGYITVKAGTLSMRITVVQGTEDQMSLLVTDASPEKINQMVFVRWPGYNPSHSEQLTVTWCPEDIDVAVSEIAYGAVPFDYGTGSNLNLLQTITGGHRTFTISPPPFTDAELDSSHGGDPFIEKSARVYFTLTDNGETMVQSLDLKQISYDLTTDLADIYYMDGSEASFNVLSNTEWTAEIVSDPKKVVSELLTTSGGPDITTGVPLRFRMTTDPDKLIDKGTATVKFHCTAPDGVDFDVMVDITATSDDPPITGSNTYMVTPGGAAVEIPISWANKDGVKRFNAADDITVEMLWTDNSAGMSASGVVRSVSVKDIGINRKLVVTPGTGTGNAVIAVKTGGNIVWSWQIWNTDYMPESGGTVYSNNGYHFMDRNLGALSGDYENGHVSGTFYQWGRKDPFPGPASLTTNTSGFMTIYNSSGGMTQTTNEANTSADNFENAVRNPMTFYTGTSWWTDVRAEASLWSDVSGGKTSYDPCPDGWRVPPTSTTNSLSAWAGLDQNNFLWETNYNYRISTTLGKWKHSGLLMHSTTVVFNMIMSYGYFWSSSQAANYNAMGFSSGNGIGNVNVAESQLVTRGMNVRCVRDY